MKKVLLTNIGSGLGRMLCHRLPRSWRISGVDSRRPRRLPGGIPVHVVELEKRRFEEVMRAERPEAVIHLTAGTGRPREVRGTKRLLDHCADYGVRQLVVLSSGSVYGAFPENSFEMDEDSLLAASRREPEIRDLVEIDTLATTFLWKFPHIRTSVLRPVSVLGPTAQSLIGRYLLQRRVATVAGFDPMMQFIHEEDLASAVSLVLEDELQGVYNIVGPGEVPLHTAIRETGAVAWPVPEFALRQWFEQLSSWGLGSFTIDVIDYLKYPICLSGQRFVDASRFRCRYGLSEIFDCVRT